MLTSRFITWLWTWSLLSQLGLGLLTEKNRNCNWKESLGGNRIAQLLHVEQSIAIKLLRALLVAPYVNWMSTSTLSNHC